MILEIKKDDGTLLVKSKLNRVKENFMREGEHLYECESIVLKSDCLDVDEAYQLIKVNDSYLATCIPQFYLMLRQGRGRHVHS